MFGLLSQTLLSIPIIWRYYFFFDFTVFYSHKFECLCSLSTFTVGWAPVVSVFCCMVNLWEMTSFTINNLSFKTQMMTAIAVYQFFSQRVIGIWRRNTTNGNSSSSHLIKQQITCLPQLSSVARLPNVFSYNKEQKDLPYRFTLIEYLLRDRYCTKCLINIL